MSGVDRSRLAIFTSSLGGGGVQRSMRNLAVALVDRGYAVDLIVCHDDPTLAGELRRAGVHVTVLSASTAGLGRLLALAADPGGWRELGPTVLWPLKTWRKLDFLAGLRDHLRARPPIGLLSAMTQCNLVAVWAHRLAGRPGRVVVSERNMLSSFITRYQDKSRWRHLAPLVRRTYARADAIIGVSQAVADDLIDCAGLDRARLHTAPNPVIDTTLRHHAGQPRRDGWFAPGQAPVVLGVGRLVDQKDPHTLLRAFARVRANRPVRLVLIGDGDERAALADHATRLGVADDVALPGWDEQPFSAMAAAGVFVLPSRWEGLPGVLIQALACGCPVVATDCPGGSAEVLDNGRYGALVAVGDEIAMARAIEAALDTPGEVAVRREHAERYSANNAAACYAALLDPAATRPSAPTEASIPA
ncbi:glycosyltransferase [Salinisphaera sp. Q1T1-3]|uniref:glycosyltransferase n=1 Tax=Salinisphaera sp. Q1T1-3 TaxID=2321229 RepID=UPI00269243DB|nr:glycosyltransferase [Salinisphaera sp. Q1T1-3]